MSKKHIDIIESTGAVILSTVPRLDGKGAKAYVVRKDGKEYTWATSSIDRGIPPWEFSKKTQKKYVYGKHPYVYRMFDSDGTLLYVGKTCQLDYRLYAHFYKYREEWKDRVAYMDAHRFDRESDMHVYEMYLVTRDKPVFNRDASCVDTPSFELPELTFEELTDWD